MNIAEIGRETRLNVPAEVLQDLQVSLAATRLPQQQAGPDWATGTPISFVNRLVQRWRSGFDWRAWEERINRFNNRLVEVDGVTIHVLVEPGSGPNPLPLVLTNGWPGSFLEFLDIIDVLAHPERHGGDLADAFTVILPSLPGYGLSPAPSGPIAPARVAELWAKLLRETFGQAHFGAYGADWGSLVTAEWARNHPEGLAGFVLTTPGGMPYLAEGEPPLCEAELAWLEAAKAVNAREAAYQALQGTKPQSLAYGHTDSPAAMQVDGGGVDRGEGPRLVAAGRERRSTPVAGRTDRQHHALLGERLNRADVAVHVPGGSRQAAARAAAIGRSGRVLPVAGRSRSAGPARVDGPHVQRPALHPCRQRRAFPGL